MTEAENMVEPVVLFLGCVLIVGAIKFLFYAMDCGGYLFYVAFTAGFIPFAIGGILVLSCFLRDPPPIFGIAIVP
jgi:hypothetical protein